MAWTNGVKLTGFSERRYCGGWITHWKAEWLITRGCAVRGPGILVGGSKLFGPTYQSSTTRDRRASWRAGHLQLSRDERSMTGAQAYGCRMPRR